MAGHYSTSNAEQARIISGQVTIVSYGMRPFRYTVVLADACVAGTQVRGRLVLCHIMKDVTKENVTGLETFGGPNSGRSGSLYASLKCGLLGMPATRPSLWQLGPRLDVFSFSTDKILLRENLAIMLKSLALLRPLVISCDGKEVNRLFDFDYAEQLFASDEDWLSFLEAVPLSRASISRRRTRIVWTANSATSSKCQL